MSFASKVMLPTPSTDREFTQGLICRELEKSNDLPPSYLTGWQMTLRFNDMKTSSASIDLSNRLFARILQHSKEFQDDKYDRDYDQSVDPIAGFWETWTYSPTEGAKQPQYY